MQVFMQRLIPQRLGPFSGYELGIIAGNRGYYLPTRVWIPGENDGLVSVASTRLEGMTDFLLLPVGHTFIMQKPLVIKQTLYFLRTG